MQSRVAKFEGKLFIVSQLEEVDEALHALEEDLNTEGTEISGVGIDFEWKPQLQQGERNPIATVQLATDNVAIVFQMLRLQSMPTRLEKLLVNPAILKIGHDLERSDVHKLYNNYRIKMSNTKDLLPIAKNRGFDRLNLATLCGATLGLHLSKNATLTDWSSLDLTPTQVNYAATDAWVTRQIYLVFESEYWSEIMLENTGAYFDDSTRTFCCGLCDSVFSDVVECCIHASEERHYA